MFQWKAIRLGSTTHLHVMHHAPRKEPVLEGGVRKPQLPSKINPLEALDVEKLLEATQSDKRKRDGESAEEETQPDVKDTPTLETKSPDSPNLNSPSPQNASGDAMIVDE
jgi:hypothetical protein